MNSAKSYWQIPGHHSGKRYRGVVLALLLTGCAWKYGPTLELWAHYQMCWQSQGLQPFFQEQHVLKELALSGNRRALGYFLAVSERTDGAMAEFHGGDLADVFLALGDEAVAQAIPSQSAGCKEAILAILPGDFTEGSTHFQWATFPRTHALLKDWTAQSVCAQAAEDAECGAGS